MTPPIPPSQVLTAEQYARVRQHYSDDEIRAQGYEIPEAAPITPGHSKFTAPQLADRANRQVENAQEAQTTPSADEIDQRNATVAGGLAAFTPAPLRALGMLVSSKVNDIPYGDAYQTINDAENANPVTPLNRATGDIAGFMGTPGLNLLSAPMQGAAYGVASGLSDPNPDLSLGARGTEGALDAAAGYAIGKAPALLRLIRGGQSASSGPVVHDDIAPKSLFGDQTRLISPLGDAPAPVEPSLTSTPAPEVAAVEEPTPELFRGRPVRSVGDALRAKKGMASSPPLPFPHPPTSYVSPDEKSALAQLLSDQEGVQPDVAPSDPDLLRLLEETLRRQRR